MKKPPVLLIKVSVMLAIVGFLAYQIYESFTSRDLPPHWWRDITFHWSFAGPAAACMAGVYLTSGLVWLFLARGMGDRTRLTPALGAYTFSQMGKYIPGKVALLLMRIERTTPLGMTPRVCTLSTLLENALYIVSGGLAGMLAILAHAKDLAAEGPQYQWTLPLAALAVCLLLAACHPRVFYGLVNVMLRKMKREPVAPDQQLRMTTLLVAVILFLPCWFFGGLSMWAAARLVVPDLPLYVSLSLMGAFALSVIIGMISFLPGGLGTRDAVLALFLGWELRPLVGDKSIALAFIAVLAQRLAQIAAEIILGFTGGALTSLRAPAPAPTSPKAD